MLTFKNVGFTTIGLQLYPRSGAQKGLLYNEVETSVPIEHLIDKPIYSDMILWCHGIFTIR